jgi:NADH-quinone oxidoreductase subunit L
MRSPDVSSSVISYAWLVPFLPLLGAAIAAIGGRWLRERSHYPVVIGTALAFVVALGLLGAAKPEQHTTVMEWLSTGPNIIKSLQDQPAQGSTLARGQLYVPVEFRVDGLTTVMLAMVTFVSTLVAIFAAGYMAGEKGYPRFFACVGLFVFSMTGLVLSDNYLLTYVFWEGVGTCSYLLVGFWYFKPAAATAAKKAFLVNRVGDFGFAVAVLLLWKYSMAHDMSYDNVFSASNLGQMSTGVKLAIAALIVWAATAKSAQIPLYVWLPDAMEGPTPVSALIHAATMVTAGVYLIARSTPLFVAVPTVQVTLAVIGCATALLSAAIALTQTDLKRVLAYSTVSQLGYMFMGLGAGIGGLARVAVVAAIFHLFTHAFFKALLFLSAGSVMHSMGGVIDMRRFRGLRHRMPITCWTFAVGGLALAGIPPLAGFWSKDEILSVTRSAASHSTVSGGGLIYMAIYGLAVLTAFLTAFYTGRAFFLTFFGPEKLPSPDDPEAEALEEVAHAAASDADHGHTQGHGGHEIGHESPPVMTIPLIILAAGAVLVGLLFGPTHLFEHQLEKTLGFEALGDVQLHADVLTMVVGSLVGLLGLALSAMLYAQPSTLPGRLAAQFGALYRASYEKFHVDEFYEAAFVRPLWLVAKICAFLDQNLVDALVTGIAWIPRLFARAFLAPLQNGLVQFYAGVMALGVAILLTFLMLFS